MINALKNAGCKVILREGRKTYFQQCDGFNLKKFAEQHGLHKATTAASWRPAVYKDLKRGYTITRNGAAIVVTK